MLCQLNITIDLGNFFLIVTIEGNMFRGFLMQARDPMDMVIGTFQTTTTSQQLLNCSPQPGIGAEVN